MLHMLPGRGMKFIEIDRLPHVQLIFAYKYKRSKNFAKRMPEIYVNLLNFI